MNKGLRIGLLALTFIAHTHTHGATTKKGLYGKDNRVDIFMSTESRIRNKGESVAAMVANSKLSSDGEKDYTFKSVTLEDHGMCSNVNFSKQPLLSACTGFLIAPDLVMTAGHCMLEFSDCSNYSWVFDYRIEKLRENKIPKQNIYSCKRIVAKDFSPEVGIDYAIIQLSRSATGRRPLELSSNSLNPGTFVAMIGHPTGLPMKVTSGANTISEGENSSTTTLDAFGGNSGSPVFDRADGKLIGMLISGGEDFVIAKDKNCKIEKKCKAFSTANGCSGEEVMKIKSAPISKVIEQYRRDSILMESVYYGEGEIFQSVMLESDVDFNQTVYGWSLLHQAVFGANLSMVKKLISKGVDLDLTENSDNATALVMAIEMEHFAIANLLIEAGANLDIATERMNDTALTAAVARHMVDLALVIVKKGARTDIPTKNGYTAVDLVNLLGIYELTEVLSGF
ncbi:MAG: trypsin-like peptidase domain-containing protein [Bacteriovoracaceae bacterium]|nr:trypsin-like peptidase domain-containing protein [Bacteriovoracaceae bacterium]